MQDDWRKWESDSDTRGRLEKSRQISATRVDLTVHRLCLVQAISTSIVLVSASDFYIDS